MRIKILLLAATSALTLSACATVAQPAPTPCESTAFTLATDQPLTPEQQAMQFDKADLSIKVLPDDKAIDAVAVLDFTAKAPLTALVVELDTLLTISSVQIDGVEVVVVRIDAPLPVLGPLGPDGALEVSGRAFLEEQ